MHTWRGLFSLRLGRNASCLHLPFHFLCQGKLLAFTLQIHLLLPLLFIFVSNLSVTRTLPIPLSIISKRHTGIPALHQLLLHSVFTRHFGFSGSKSKQY